MFLPYLRHCNQSGCIDPRIDNETRPFGRGRRKTTIYDTGRKKESPSIQVRWSTSGKAPNNKEPLLDQQIHRDHTSSRQPLGMSDVQESTCTQCRREIFLTMENLPAQKRPFKSPAAVEP
ncbi:hypothetical protein IscW_ISCW008539 [Ixodes scapularis]|uniref:Uncharacterized protein n=1 Tax=Ixodes scapularis TaxID=6945 RepID=B7PXM2_IXOSC|nr:hypothetical protein IscW_ISCW008539 [Ixodes scapularis]|eukprot:XP_002401278.1 hypothetical protein IscW_ISCW008539 [Ixodes scapularis]